MATHRWFHVTFDVAFVVCQSCGTRYTMKSVQRRNKCPHCKLDNHGCKPLPRNPPMLCGHPVSAIVSTDEGTHYCGECARESEQGAR